MAIQNSKSVNCQNCHKNFTIESEDFAFYDKILVPPPTFCPSCRFQRRLAFFNLTTLYKRSCDLCKKNSISMYAPDAPYAVYCPKCWWSDNWDPFQYGREYDFSKSFFEQFNELLRQVPLLGLSMNSKSVESSPYNNHAGILKNCYLIFYGGLNEDCAYGLYIEKSARVFDCGLMNACENCYDSMHGYKNYGCVGADHIKESIDCFFTKDCVNCQNCFASVGLRNKNYHIFNKPYAKEDYFKEIEKYDLGSYRTYTEIKEKARALWKQFPPKPRWDEFSANVSGNYVFESQNCQQCFEVIGTQDSKYLFMMVGPGKTRNSYDCSGWGDNQELGYECCITGENVSNVRFLRESGLNLYNAEYCKLSLGGSNYFGCVSIKKGSYCILNKKYSEEEFENLRAKIIKHMNDNPYTDKNGRVYRYGEFFPIELSPFAYNTTVAQRFFPLSKDEITICGYRFEEEEKRTYPITKQGDFLPDHIKDVDDSIMNEVIGCETCPRGFKIIPMELQFLRRMNLPLPRECPFCRIDEKFKKWVNNLKIAERTCDKCSGVFETSYTETEAPRIFCKKCYQAEVV